MTDPAVQGATKAAELERQLAEVRAQSQKAERTESILVFLLKQYPSIMTVPPDILIRIFEEGLKLDDGAWDNHLWFSDEKRGEIPSILVASHVNRRWRDTALGSSCLWRNLKITSTQSLPYLDMFWAKVLGRLQVSRVWERKAPQRYK
ncbi:hypothetical protein PILCRDRAFT_830034 [Piloderma croceum F 1598]|uniref:Uncharacterized protein n=1 Tax=Piloderma croceum (strain F 1598) TaxID=765440 RepID=A0A0C3ADW0_PILCF|nr:hypothetical protein PILCRDRAFT_830034 [Piloderma croceum F 1598]